MTSYPDGVSAAAQTAVAIVLLLAGAALLVVACLGASGRLKRNRFAGVRSPATMASAEAFALGNRVAAPPMLGAALLLLLAGGAFFALAGAAKPVVIVLGLLGAAVLMVVGGLLGNRAASGCATERCVDCTGCALMESRS